MFVRFEGLVLDGRQDAVQPRPLVALPRRREGGAAQLLGVQPVRRALRVVAAGGQRARTPRVLAGELVAEAGLVALVRRHVALQQQTPTHCCPPDALL